MSRRVPKSVSVSVEVDELISHHFPKRGTFSAFVRAAVLDHAEMVEGGGGPHTPIERLGICNGMRRPTCSICYPEGPPSAEAWQRFAELCSPFEKDINGNLSPRYAEGYIPVDQYRNEMLESIGERPKKPRVDKVVGQFPEKLSLWKRIIRKLRR